MNCLFKQGESDSSESLCENRLMRVIADNGKVIVRRVAQSQTQIMRLTEIDL